MSLPSTSPILPTPRLEPLLPALAATIDRSDIEDSVRWVDSVLGTPAMLTRLLILDEGGRLRVIFEGGLEDVGRNQSMRRHETIMSERTCLIHLRRPRGDSLAIMPLVCRGEVLGVLEVAAADHVIGERLAALEAVASQTAVVLGNLGVIRSAAPRVGDTTAQVPGLLQELLAAASREQAVEAVVRFFWHRRGIPAVGWLRESGDHAFRLVASRGIARETQEALRRGMDTVDTDTMVRSGGHILEGAKALVTRAGDAVVLLKDSAVTESHLIETVEAGLGLALDRSAMSDAVADLTGSIDAGLAWTAHELRAPLLGVEKAIDSVCAGHSVPDRDRRLIEGAQTELRRLADMVDDVLRWSVGAASIRRRPTDLVRLVEEIARSLSLYAGSRRLTVDAPQKAVVFGDPHLLRIAVENLMRNSLQHARDDVHVAVELTAREATVSVSDMGQGIPPDERAVIFEPFVRGRRASRGGRGLGLFIAQRVVQAHGGALWFEAGSNGSVFRMRFPRGPA
jgi:signal transduction histidine kinase